MTTSTSASPLLELRVTAASERHIEIALAKSGYSPSQIESAKRLWRLAHEKAVGTALKYWGPVFDLRLHGPDGAPSLELMYDADEKTLVFTTAGARVATRLQVRAGKSLSPKLHQDELGAIDAQRLIETDDGVVVALIDRHATLTAKALVGDPHALARLGIARVSRPLFPAAFQEATAERDPTSGLLSRKEVVALPGVDDLDVVQYFEELRLEGRLPLASTESVRRFVMLLASPLLRDVYAGALLGIYWITGPPGAGKEFCIALARAIWESVGLDGARAVLEMRDATGTEDRKTMATAIGAVYAQAREAGKHATAFLDHLIRTTGSSTLSVRGNYRDEIEIANKFTFIADSAESVPERREISRRTSVITIEKVDEGFPTIAIRKQVAAMGPRIIASLKRAIESSEVELDQVVSPDGRPHGQMLLSQLFGASLDVVEGEDLSMIFRAMAWYAGHSLARRLPPTPNSAKIASQHPNFDAAHFVETMRDQVGFRVYFETMRTPRNLARRIEREKPEYRKQVVKGGADYLEVDVDGRAYGFRFTSERPLRFIFFRLHAEPDVHALPRPVRAG